MTGKLLLSVGAMKAGTTWLYHKLNQHPEIHFSPKKELHYFAYKFGVIETPSLETREVILKATLDRLKGQMTETNKNYIRCLKRWHSDCATGEINDEWFHRVMNSQRHQDKYLADFSNLTCMINNQDWQVLKKQYKPLKVIYIMRDPIKRLWSHYKYHLQFTNRKISTNSNADFLLFQSILSKKWFIGHAYYSEILSRLRESLTNDELIICYFEDMITDPASFLIKIESFLNIPKNFYNEESLLYKQNAGIDILMPDEWCNYAYEVLKDEIKSLKNSNDWSNLWTS
jgi:hypothetical protein